MPKVANQYLNNTSALVLAYCNRIKELNGAPLDVSHFAVAPEIEQKLEDKIRENSDFLGDINIVPVRDKEGEKIGLDVTGTIASRTNTDNSDRATGDTLALDNNTYRCEKTDFDTHIKWSTLDTWSRFPDFQNRITNAVTRQIARDRLMIGWNGTSVAADTDKIANPLLQDVNIGWLKQIETNSPSHYTTAVKVGSEGSADFKNYDAAVYSMRNTLLAPWHRNSTDLVVIMGSGMLIDKNVASLNANETPTERAALATIITNQLVGGMRSIIVPFFPADSIFITSLDNLSIYFQEGSRRRRIADNPKRDRLEDFQSVNEAYVVEDYKKTAVMANILQWNGVAWA
jgi:P2 family phage major capsid protein